MEEKQQRHQAIGAHRVTLTEGALPNEGDFREFLAKVDSRWTLSVPTMSLMTPANTTIGESKSEGSAGDMRIASPTSDPRPVFRRCTDLVGSVVAAISPGQLDLPTPCGDFDVRQLLGHVVAAGSRVAQMGRGNDVSPGLLSPPNVADDGWTEAWGDAAQEMDRAWGDDAALVRVVRLPWIEASGAAVLASYLNEFTVHAWDLATATGQSPLWDDEVVGLALDSIRVVLPSEGRQERFEAIRASLRPHAQNWSSPFADAVAVSNDAPLIDQLVAYNGRRP